MKLYPVDIPLKVVSGESLNLMCQILVKVKFDGKFEILLLVIMKGCNLQQFWYFGWEKLAQSLFPNDHKFPNEIDR
jgi:hypothetical protein